MKNTQVEKVKQHLKDYLVITSWEAIQKYRITRLSAIIYILRNEHGMKINSNWETGNNKSWVEYKLHA